MRKIKISFLAIVALLAMSFTVATHEGGFKKASKKSRQVFICRADQGQNMFYRAFFSCLNGVNYQQGISPCPPMGHGSFNCAQPTSMVPNQTTITCPGGQRFCCAVRVTSSPIACPTTCARVRVFCMP